MKSNWPTGYKEIRERIKANILSGALAPGARVPSIRALAQEIGVAKRTVEWAYDLLISEGYLLSEGSRGTFVNTSISITISPKREPRAELSLADSNEQNKIGYFRPGIPAFDKFPLKLWRRLANQCLSEVSADDFLSPSGIGFRPLREAISSYLGLSRGFSVSPHQVFITNGHSESLDLILRSLQERGLKIVIEEPGYFATKTVLKSFDANYYLTPSGTTGLDVGSFLKQHSNSELLITTPTHHSPFAVSLPLPERQRLLAWASKKKRWIVEDDYDGEFHYEKQLVPALKSHDFNDRVIHLGSFSKTLLPSLRVSYVVVPKSLQARFFEVASVRSGHSVLSQRIIAQFLTEGHFARHLKKMRVLYKERRAFTINAIESVFPGRFQIDQRNGGLLIAARFIRQEEDDIEIAETWNHAGLAVMPLSRWYESRRKVSGLVFGFTNVNSETEAVQELKRVKQLTNEIGNRKR
jgi:GntR family transcriptional regulator/MocR family aminotransferase